MRPKKRILLVSSDAEAAGILRYSIETTGLYLVKITARADVALVLMKHEVFDTMLVSLPLPCVDQLLCRAKTIDPAMVRVTLTPGAMPALNAPADANLADVPMDELRQHLKVWCATKRGPRKGSKRQPELEWFTLPTRREMA